MKPVKSAKVKFSLSWDYTDMVNQMIEDGELINADDIKDFLLGCIFEDVETSLSDGIDESDVKITIK